MCPACLATVVLMAGGLMTTGGLAALLLKISGSEPSKKTVGPEQSNEKEN